MANKYLCMRHLSVSPVPNLGKTTRSPQSDLTPWILTLPQQLTKIHLPQYDTFQQQWPLDPHLKINQIKHAIYHKMYSLWALVGDSGGSPGLENALKRWVGPIWPICFSVYFNASLYFFNYEQPREIHGLVHRSKMQAR